MTPPKADAPLDAEFNLTPTVPVKAPTPSKAEVQSLGGLINMLNKPDINPQTPQPLLPKPAPQRVQQASILPGPRIATGGRPQTPPAKGPISTLQSPQREKPMLLGPSHGLKSAPSRVAPTPAPAARAHSAPSAAAVERIPLAPQGRIFFTGRMKVGKDHCATAAGARAFGLAEPLYALLKVFFGTDNKDAYGAREFLQKLGQWGRGLVTADYPVTAERAALTALIRGAKSLPPELCVEWAKFGFDADIWINALLKRSEPVIAKEPDQRYAVTNVRFDNELKALKGSGWEHWHVMCSDETRNARLRQSGLDPSGNAQRDASEQVARAFDASVVKNIKTKQRGAMLRCIWSDDKIPCPSARIYTVDQWLQEIAIADA